MFFCYFVIVIYINTGIVNTLEDIQSWSQTDWNLTRTVQFSYSAYNPNIHIIMIVYGYLVVQQVMILILYVIIKIMVHKLYGILILHQKHHIY